MKRIAASIVVLFALVATLANAGDRSPLTVVNGAITFAGSGDTLVVPGLKVKGVVMNPPTVSAPGIFAYATFIHNWAPTVGPDGIAAVYATSNDDPGTTITGISSSGLTPGDATIEGSSIKVCNLAGVADAFTLTLKNLDTRSALGNRILTPGAGDGARCSITQSTHCVVDADCPGGETCNAIDADYTISSNTCATLVLRKAWLARADTTHYAWTIPNAPTRFNHLQAIGLQIYPGLLTNTISGTIDNYTPACDGTADCSSGNSYTCSLANTAGTGSAACGLSGGTLNGRDYTVIRVQTNASGAKITGLHYDTQNVSISALGPVKFLSNAGPGVLTIANHASATGLYNIDIGSGGTSSDIVLQPNQGVLLYRLNADSGAWFVLGRSDYYFSGRSVTATDGIEMTGTDAGQPLGASWLTNAFFNDTHSSFAVSTATNFPQVAARANGSYNTTANAASVYGLYSTANATRTGGANPVINYGLYASSQSGDTNYAAFFDAGDIILNNASGLSDFRSSSVIFRQHQRHVGTAPTLSSCGTSPSTVTGNDTGGFFTTGSATTSCTMTFASTFGIEPDCILSPQGTGTQPAYTVSATAMSMTTVIASTKYHYQCHQLN